MTVELLDANSRPPTIRRGTSPTLVFNVFDAEGAPKNLVGATEVTFAIAKHRSASARDLQLTLGDGMSHDGTGGNVTAVFTTVQTEALPVGQRWCELWITDVNAVRDLVGEGFCQIHDTLVTVA